jgi:hypothetical protein
MAETRADGGRSLWHGDETVDVDRALRARVDGIDDAVEGERTGHLAPSLVRSDVAL